MTVKANEITTALAGPHVPHPDALVTREALAKLLTSAGYPISAKTLATRASRGGGPAFSKFLGRALYRWGNALEWAQKQLTPCH